MQAVNPVERAESQAVRTADLPKLTTGSPFSFSGSVTLTPGSSLPVNESAFTNNTSRPIEVHEIKFAFSVGAPASGVTVMIAVKTAKGMIKRITQTPVPVSLLGIKRSDAAEITEPGTVNGEFIGGRSSVGLSLGSSVWRVDVPFYLLPGDMLMVTLSHSNLIGGSILAQVTASGKIVAKTPARTMLPYVAAFIGQQIDFLQSSLLPQSSSEKQLVNALKVPVRVLRFVGRAPSIVYGDFVDAGWIIINDAMEQLITLTMRSSQGVPNVRFPTPFGRVFEAISCALEAPHTLAPGAYYIVTITPHASPSNLNPLPNIQMIPMIAMIGEREDRP